MIQKKPWYTSVILWVNLITAAVAILRMAAQLSFITPQVGEGILFGVAALNIVLRMLSAGTPITEVGVKKARAIARGNR